MYRDIQVKQYSKLISKISKDLGPNFQTLCSPTFSKQETVTFLFNSIFSTSDQKKPKFTHNLLSTILFIPRLAWMFIKVLLISQFLKINYIPEQSVIFRSWLVPRCFSNNNFRDEYFKDLPEDLSSSEAVVTCYSGTDVKLLIKFTKLLKNQSRKNVYHSLGLLSVSDVFQLFWEYIRHALIIIKKPYFLNGVNITPLVNQSCFNDYVKLNSFEAFSEKYKCRRLIKHKIKAFVYVFENQSWEKVACHEFKGANIKTIAYQSSGFSKRFLNFYPNKIDCLIDPAPDVILTVGHNFKKHLLENAFFKCPIEEFCALRFSYPFHGNRYTVQAPNRQIHRHLLYAFSVNLFEYKQIIEDLIDVFGNSDVVVDLKFHPLYSRETRQFTSLLPSNFQIIDHVEIKRVNMIYDCVIFNDNSFGIECLFFGIKCFEYQSECNKDDLRLFYFNEWPSVISKLQLENLRDQLISQKFIKCYNEKNIRKYLNRMYRPYTGEEFNKFKKILNN